MSTEYQYDFRGHAGAQASAEAACVPLRTVPATPLAVWIFFTPKHYLHKCYKYSTVHSLLNRINWLGDLCLGGKTVEIMGNQPGVIFQINCTSPKAGSWPWQPQLRGTNKFHYMKHQHSLLLLSTEHWWFHFLTLTHWPLEVLWALPPGMWHFKCIPKTHKI